MIVDAVEGWDDKRSLSVAAKRFGVLGLVEFVEVGDDEVAVFGWDVAE